ncbi:MAG: DUF4270 family protein [Bacteroidetes bacterium]|nr:MAG: DUF4270 family protein [Bacteroidota bacterium]
MKHSIVKHILFMLLLSLGLFAAYNCNKPTPFGADLLDDQLADYDYTDTLTVWCTVLPEDSLITADRSSTFDYFFCGELKDPVFGYSRSDIYSLFRLSGLSPNFKDALVDSIVMYLRYDNAGIYGDTLQPQTLRVHRLAQDTVLHWSTNYYSNQSFPVGEQLGEVANFLPQPNTDFPLLGDSTNTGPYVRIPLDNAFGQEILDIDSLDLTTDSTFWTNVRGLRISSESGGDPGAMLAFDLNNSSFSFIRLYYKYATDTITESRAYTFSFVGGNKFTGFTHDYTGSTVAPYLQQQADDLLFVQGMSGLRLKVQFPYAHLIDNIAVNKAELELTAAVLPGDNPLLEPAKQLVLTESVGDTTVSLTSDVLYSLGSALTGGFNAFGGFPEEESDNGMIVDRYRMTLTRRFQAMVDNTSGDIKDQTLFINVYPQSRSAGRAVFYGPKSTTFPAKLILKYTRVQ